MNAFKKNIYNNLFRLQKPPYLKNNLCTKFPQCFIRIRDCIDLYIYNLYK